MRIVQLANFVGPSSGGLRVAVSELGARYAGAGHEVARIVPGPRDELTVVDDVEVHHVASPKVPLMGGYRALIDRRRLGELVTRLAPDAVELSDKTTMVAGARAARHRGSRVVLVSHERLDAILADRVGWASLRDVTDRWNRRLLPEVDAIACASAFAAEEFVRIGARTVAHVPLGVDLDTFRPTDRSVTNGPHHPRTIVCLGRLSMEKRPMTALAAFRELHARRSDVRLLFIGDGPERHRLERAAEALPVDFVGHLESRGELAALLRSADVAIAPCPHETFGLGVMECLASGLPVVVPNGGALPELVRGCGAGEVVPDHPPAYAAALVRLLDTPGILLAAAARTRAEAFSWDRTTTRMLGLLTGHRESTPILASRS